MSKVYIYIGRFQPFHNGHETTVLQSLSEADKLIILVGSSYQPRTPKNPFTFTERKEMIMNSISEESRHKVEVLPLRDYLYNEEKWLAEVQAKVFQHTNKQEDKIFLIGHEKDESSYYLKKFPQWPVVDTGFRDNINATDIREAYLTESLLDRSAGLYLPTSSIKFLTDFKATEHFTQLIEEHRFYKKEAALWAFAKYPPIFNTADAVVIQSGHILMIQRIGTPGKGLWALPGGHLSGDTYLDAAIRELQEETSIALQEIVLRRSIKSVKIYDHPKRSLRGHVITAAHLIHLEQMGDKLPKVTAGDDAGQCKWFPLSQVLNMEEYLFEDHYQIITEMIGQCGY